MANGWHCRTHFYTSTSSPLHRKVYTLALAKKTLPHIPSPLIPASFCTPWPTGRSLLSSSSGKKRERSPGTPPANVPLTKPPPTSDPCPSQPLPKNPEQWSPAHVLKYLVEKQVEYYLTDIHIAKFREQEIAGRDLLTLTKKDLGQPPFDLSHGPAIRIERLINVLRNLQGNTLQQTRRYHCCADTPQHIERETMGGSEFHFECRLGNEQKRILLIAPILFYILKAFRDSGVSDMKILVERSVPGKNINVNSKFEFIIQRGKKRICVVEAKKDDMDQGMTQDLLGCEAIADVENSSCVYGIVTNYRDWLFFRSLDDKIERDSLTLAMTGPGGYLPSEEGLKGIVGKIYALLSE
ncbi:hypothetical protein EV426DRAFT_700529 [Tirmania nivea]|nr:hypothetical protein EV426DRAFT_700529 [Tirmania nivea]